jgi:hypothetical protein
MPTSSLEKLKIQQAKITARIQQMEARSKVTERKQDLRRKILVGSYYIDQTRDKKDFEVLKRSLDSYLTRNSDRRLFELPDIEEPAKEQKKSKPS